MNRTIKYWEKRLELILMKGQWLEAEIRIAELRFNPYHDEKGRFTTEKESTSLIDVTSEYEKNATSGKGSFDFDNNYRVDLHKNEILFANWLYSHYGGNIRLLDEINQNKIPTADFIWNDKLWDLKTVTTEIAANSALRKGLKQISANPGGIILNYKNANISMAKLNSVIKKRMKWYGGNDVDIMIVNNGNVIKIIRYKKRGAPPPK